LLDDKDIIRNKRKIEAVINNAKAVLSVIKEFGSFNEYLWSFVDGTPIIRNKNLHNWEDLPNRSPESEKLARDMKNRGFTFVGPISCYAFMQATGLVDDRINVSCNRSPHRVKS
jgi:DNA-3-methyladenine glycosylase I